MKQDLTFTEASPQGYLQAKRSLYNTYAALLLGYILDIVKNQATAEQYLVDLFADLHPADVADLQSTGNVFIRLQQLARKKLKSFFDTLHDCAPADLPPFGGDNFTTQMTPEQKLVFCSIHYHGKSTTQLAADLGRPEAEVRQLLKQAFTIIRSNRK